MTGIMLNTTALLSSHRWEHGKAVVLPAVCVTYPICVVNVITVLKYQKSIRVMDLIVGEAIHIYCKVRRSSSMLFISWIKETTHGFWNLVFEVRLQLPNSILVVINEIHFLSCFMHRCSSQPQRNTAALTPSGEAITTSFIFFATIPGVPIARARNRGTQPFTLMSSSGQNASSHCQGFCFHLTSALLALFVFVRLRNNKLALFISCPNSLTSGKTHTWSVTFKLVLLGSIWSMLQIPLWTGQERRN